MSAALAGYHGQINMRLSFPHPLLVSSGHVESIHNIESRDPKNSPPKYKIVACVNNNTMSERSPNINRIYIATLYLCRYSY